MSLWLVKASSVMIFLSGASLSTVSATGIHRKVMFLHQSTKLSAFLRPKLATSWIRFVSESAQIPKKIGGTHHRRGTCGHDARWTLVRFKLNYGAPLDMSFTGIVSPRNKWNKRLEPENTLCFSRWNVRSSVAHKFGSLVIL